MRPLALPDAFTPEECDRIVALAEAAGLSRAGLVGGLADPRIRRAGIAWLDEAEGAAWVSDRLARLVADANREGFGFALDELAESPQVARYDAGEAGHFDWHSDIGEGPVARRRKLTLVVQLSDAAAYAGGALELMPGTGILAADRAQGAAIAFPSFVLHRVAPVTRGVRHSLTIWAHGPAFR
ncbi:MAG: 2OG-Fe(II) oxygenase [Rhodobacteraceae bacterium]|nr:2OG-Fe(II) oxygenase [Paracoccaceae bacterium]